MKKLLTIFTVLILLLTSGCMNLYTRSPFTEKRLERTYQPSGETFGLAIIVSFPQMMSDNPSTPDFMVENIFTIPCGIIVGVDGCAELVLDTVFWPFDKIIVYNRTKDKKQWNGN